MLSTFLFSMRIPELNSLVINLATEMAQNLEGTALSGTRWSPGRRTKQRESDCENGIQKLADWLEPAQHSTGEMAPEAVDNFSAKRF
jgi:hypothetical protein